MYLEDLKANLIALARRRVRAGELSERGLARQCAISQPHMHNVLNNIRSLSTDAADRLMRALHVNAADLLWPPSGESGMGVRGVPVLRSRIGPGAAAVFDVNRGIMPFPSGLVDDLVDCVAARLAPDLALPRELAANDLALLDRNPIIRQNPTSGGTWIIAGEGGLLVRYLLRDGSTLYLADNLTLEHPEEWRPIELRGRNLLDVVRARIVWIGREMQA